MSRSARVILFIAVLGTVGQAVSLVSRGRIGNTDFGVFHRTVQLLAVGVGGDLYPRLDAVTTWPISLSPTGLAIFQPLAGLSPIAASAAWALFNLALLALAVGALRDLLDGSPRGSPSALFVWATVLLLVFSWPSIQVGQFSVLFVTCWILALRELAIRRDGVATMLFAIPAAIKLYPAMMLATPLSLATNLAQGFRRVCVFSASFVAAALLVPVAMYGSRGWALNESFWRHVILSPSGQVQYMQTVRHANQSLDTLLLRYLSYEPDFHDLFVTVPHLWWSKSDVVAIANVLRVLFLVATVAAVWRWRTRAPRSLSSRHDLLTLGGVWSATLYLMLPETKARYSVYVFLAFLPFLRRATAGDGSAPGSTRAWTEVIVLAVLILVLLPDEVQVWGVGFVGAVLLWAGNIREMRTGG